MHKSRKGFTLIELMIVVAIIGILALIAIPNFISLRARAYNASARSAGRNAKLAEEVWFNDRESSAGFGANSYSNHLSDLLSYDKNLTDDNDVTFTFGTCNTSGYTFTTTHAKGNTTFTYND